MDEQRARIFDDLRGMIDGDLLFEPTQVAPFAQDGSLFEFEPLGVVAPRHQADLIALVRYAAEQGIPLQPRGAGTGLAGGCLGSGLVLDFSRSLRAIVSIQPNRVVVQPGAVVDDVNAQLAPLGRRLAPDPWRSEAGTIGGMIGRDAVGPRSLRWGSTADHVERLEVVLANGEVAGFGREPWPSVEDVTVPTQFRDTILHKMAALLKWHGDLIARQAASVARCGYNLHKVANSGGIHLARLLVGSHGTLGLVTEATVRTVPIPAFQRVLLLPFGRLVDAAAAVPDCLREGPSCCELVDWKAIRLVRDADPSWRDWIVEAAEAILLVGFETDDAAASAGRARALVQRLSRSGTLAGPIVETTKRTDCDRLLGLRRQTDPLLMRLKGLARPVPLLDDVHLAPAAWPEFLARLQAVFKHFEVNWIVHAQAGPGQLHPRPFLNLSDPNDRSKLEPLAVAIFETLLELGGTAAAEQGRGFVPPALYRRQQGDLAPVFREIKNLFDPQNLLNPGKVVGDEPLSVPWPVRSMPMLELESGSPSALPILEPGLRWLDRGPIEQASACNSCGACRSIEPTLRMCPSFRASRDERTSPRGRIDLIRRLAAGTLDPKLWGSEPLKQAADFCVHCHLCESECPSGIDISSLMLEVKAAYVENHGLNPSDWMLSKIELWSRLASRFPVLFNASMNSPRVRWLIERLFGLSRHRRLPRAHRTPFVRRAERMGLARPRPSEPGPRVVYFVDLVANYFDQELAEAVVDVLRHCGVNIFVPKGQRGCGMPALVAGDLDTAREQALANLRVLGNAVRDGYTILCSEPTAALMLRHEYLKLTDDLDAALVADHTMDVGQYLAGLESRGLLPRPKVPLHAKAGYHQPCHLRALEIGTPGLNLIRMIPGLEVEYINRGCSGMAGTFGMARQNFRTSLRAGRGLTSRLRDPDLEIGATECGTCRMQMEQGATKRTLHPVKLLHLAYGLNPELRQHFKDPTPKRTLS